jgi:hypothetical protein
MNDDSWCAICGEEIYDDEQSCMRGDELVHVRCLRKPVDDDPCFDRDLEHFKP